MALGPCHNARLAEDGTLLAECPHSGRSPFVQLDWPGSVLIRGLCEGCLADERRRELAAERTRRQLRLDQIAPARMREWSLATYPQDASEALVAAAAWLERWRGGERSNLILRGPVGGGKTGLAWSLIRDVVERDGELEVDFVNFRDYLEGLKLSFDSDVGFDRRPAHRKLLVLDDLGAERPTEWALNELASLVELRYGRLLATIVTTNYASADLAGRLGREDPVVGQRIVSRLADAATAVLVDAGDRRRLGRA